MTTRTRPAARLHVLTARQVQTAGIGDRFDGGGLILRIGEGSASFVLRYSSPTTGKRRETGLGRCYRASIAQAGASLTAARDLAADMREQLRKGIDPQDARRAERDAARKAVEAAKTERSRERLTLARAARDYHARVIEPTRTPKHAAQWIASLENHTPARLWNAPIASITAPELLSALLDVKPHERARRHGGDTVPETVRRIRQRFEAIFEDAIFHGHATVNPAAAVRRKMRESGPKIVRGQFAALSFKEAPALLQRLRSVAGTAASCLEFAVLSAARTSEVLLAEWSEFDLDAGLWLVPAARMKAKEAHTVYLSPRAIEVLRAQAGQDTRYVFPSPMSLGRAQGERRPLSNMAMLKVLDRLGVRGQTTVHGLCRSTFSTWANETAAARPDVIEAALAHEETNRVRAAYNRAEFATERRALLQAWADYLARPAAPVYVLDAARAA